MKEMISVSSGFQYSVNIGYDFNSDDKLKNFIPTKSAIKLLEDILLSIRPMSTDRARVLIGAYGKGKSHIVLAILSILAKKDLSLFTKLLPRLSEEKKLYQLVKNYYDSKEKILPIVITGSNTSLNQAFLLSLQRALSDRDLLSVMPETNYKAAANVIRRWKGSFPDTYKKFCVSIDIPVEKFVDRLESFDVSSYREFEKIYPSFTAGSIFNPFLGFDVVELYESVATSLKTQGYTGIYVVYDEFSKYLEANINDASVSDTKTLQDFAERCCRSGELQLHLMLISHKEILNYIDRLPKEKTDGWRGVSERFKHVVLNNNFSQTYEIISSVIQHKEPDWSNFCKNHSKEFCALFSRYEKHQIFVDTKEKEEISTVIKGCFPLHPVSTFILPRLSDRIAQNERTLFTFLSADGSATLKKFLNSYRNDFSLLTPDQIYDYFEPLLRKEVYSVNIHEVYLLTVSILNQIHENNLCSKIVKTISLIYILEQFERLSPTVEQIIGIYSCIYQVNEIEQAIAELIRKDFFVYIKKSNNFLRLKKSSGVDIQKKIHDLVESQRDNVSERDILNGANFDNYIYPARYNDKYEMTRFFAFQFIAEAEISLDINWELKSESICADGVIYGVIPSNHEKLDSLLNLIKKTSKGAKQFIFVIPKYYKEISKIAREYVAVKYLRDQSINDPLLFDEYEVVFEDLQDVINSYIGGYTHPERQESIYISDGKVLNIFRKSILTEFISGICDTVYNLTPVINNETVNKNEITSVALNSRNRIVSALLRIDLEPNLGFSGVAQEVSIMRSTLVRTGVVRNIKDIPQIELHPNNKAMNNLLDTIEDFVQESRDNGKVNFSSLYEWLVSPKYHIGLRRGVIPIYIALVLHQYRQQVVISDRSGPLPLSTDVLVQINSKPNNFFLEFLDWNSDKEKYISELISAFSDYVVEAEKSRNYYDYVSNAIYRWYMSLPKYSKDCRQDLSGEEMPRMQVDIINLLKQNISSYEFLFKKLPALFDSNCDYKKVAEELINVRASLDGRLADLKSFLVSFTKTVLLQTGDCCVDKNVSLFNLVKEWCKHLDPKCFDQLYSDGTEKVLQLFQNVNTDEDFFITKLARITTGLPIEDWNLKTIELYKSSIGKFIKTAQAFVCNDLTEDGNTTSNYQIIFADTEGHGMTRIFDRVDVSARGKLLFNQLISSLDAMGHSISKQEKRQILMDVLKKLC